MAERERVAVSLGDKDRAETRLFSGGRELADPGWRQPAVRGDGQPEAEAASLPRP